MPSKYRYEPVTRDLIPAGVRFDVPRRHQGQIIEVAYGGFFRYPHDEGDLYKRVTDYSEPVHSPKRTEFFKLISSE